MSSERGDWSVGPIAGIIIIVLAIIGLFAVCSDDDGDVDTLSRIQLVSHEYDDQDYDQWNNEDRNRNRDRNRGAFSPGPFDDSPVDAFNNVCMPGATCHYNPGPGEEPPPEEGEQRV